MNSHHYCAIMAGGIGTRFWPVSRISKPKQFLDIGNTGKTFLRDTYDRMSRMIPKENILIVTITSYKELVLQQIPELPEENLLIEPYNRDTAPCMAFAAYSIRKRDPQAIMVATPADHIITSEDLFDQTLGEALSYAEQNAKLITLGIEPTTADTNFGYIQVKGGSQARKGGKPVPVKTFTEKPDKEMAELFLKTGEFLWNSGIFIWQVGVIIEEMEKYAPLITSLWKESDDLNLIYGDCPRISIDYAVMEKTERATVIPAKFNWADIGTWSSLYEYMAKLDENGNATSIWGRSLLKDNRNSIIYSGGEKKLIAVKGLENFIVVDTDNVLMICPRDDKKLKEFLSELTAPGFEEYR